MTPTDPVPPAVSDEMVAAWSGAYAAHLAKGGRERGVDGAIAAGIAAVRPLIEAEHEANVRQQIAAHVRSLTVSSDTISDFFERRRPRSDLAASVMRAVADEIEAL